MFAKRVKQKVKQQAQDIEVRQWEEKELHGRYPKRISEADVDVYKTKQWLRSTGLKAETEGLIIAAQDQDLPTQSYYARIVKDRELLANKPDRVIKDHANQCCKLTDVSVQSDRKTLMKVIEKLSKYKDLEIETTRMWGMRAETVMVIVGALVLIRKGMAQNLGKIPGASNIIELQRIIQLGMVHILRRFQSIK